MSIGEIPHFDRGIPSFCMGKSPKRSGDFPILSGKEMSQGSFDGRNTVFVNRK